MMPTGLLVLNERRPKEIRRFSSKRYAPNRDSGGGQLPAQADLRHFNEEDADDIGETCAPPTDQPGRTLEVVA